VRSDGIERENSLRVILDNGGAGHAGNDARVFALRDGETAGSFDGAQTFGSVFPHAGHEHANGSRAKLLSYGVKEDVNGRTMAIDGSGIVEHGDVAARHAANHHVAVARADQNTPGEEEIAGAGFLHVEGAALVEAAREHFGKAFGHVLNKKNAAG